MKNSILIFSILITASLLMGCVSSGEKKTNTEKEVVKANKSLEKAKKVHLEEVKIYKAETEKVIENNKERITDLKLQATKEKENVRTENLKKIEELERQNNNMKNKLFDYHASDNNKWDKFKSEFTRDMDELRAEIAKFPQK
ncbi:hypothetical protein G5B10_13185 [Fluviicola sp. SGL-29]|nr:hypothetical protein [Fluviicola sp. SGL-29]